MEGGRKVAERAGLRYLSEQKAPLRGRASPERGLCVAGGHDSANRKEKETVESQKEVELGWRDKRMEERKETG